MKYLSDRVIGELAEYEFSHMENDKNHALIKSAFRLGAKTVQSELKQFNKQPNHKPTEYFVIKRIIHRKTNPYLLSTIPMIAIKDSDSKLKLVKPVNNQGDFWEFLPIDFDYEIIVEL